MIYEDIFDAKSAVEKLNGFQVAKRYLIVLYYQPNRAKEKAAAEMERKKSAMAGRMFRG